VLWVLIFAGIALAGLVMVVCYVVWLAHKASDVMSELGVLARQGGQLADLVGDIGASGAAGIADISAAAAPVTRPSAPNPRRRMTGRSGARRREKRKR
jgi:hypothetical protein